MVTIYALQIMVIRAAKESGLPVTCEVAPHHLFLTTDDLDNIGGLRGRVKPNLVTKEDQQSLWDNMDIIDCFATDHGKFEIKIVKMVKLIITCRGSCELLTSQSVLQCYNISYSVTGNGELTM